ncbi:malate dehydrogenase [Gonapodya prolifera JEL478]|uniref:malate dehydrogenase n=1 Tax=Gonapodya prolifera (strain JEL478) TaxID=1344416 RepID=A0A139AW18_GONPJ|nr:malate dehydrogenase [Gonapodya prolifera JEL478]|eukprot:KXS20907.1 malate dehydrogenase [Gonapodya prolifera JEL478]
MVKVAVLRAAGGIGQPLALLIKTNPFVSELSLYDVVNTPGVAADLSHINTKSKVTGWVKDAQLDQALQGADIVVIPAGVPRKPGMTRDDLFNINAGIVKTLATGIAKNCPKAFVAIISNPVNSTVPIAAETLKAHGVYDPKRLFGVTLLDVVRAATFVSEIKGTDPEKTNVAVIGGHSGPTIVPILSGTGLSFTQEQREALVKRIQYGGDEVVKAKDGTGSATLSMAYAGYRFVNALIAAGFQGKKGVVECAYVDSDWAKEHGVDFFAAPVELGPEGVAKYLPLPALDDYEKELFKAAITDLKGNIAKGESRITGKVH